MGNARSNPKVLVVEDDQSVRETLGMVLESFEYGVRLVGCGKEALVQLEKEWPDVLLLDLTLDGMTGEELFEKIQNRFGRTPPTVVLSAVQHGEKRTEHMHGVHFLAKPYTLEQLNEVIERMTGVSIAQTQPPLKAG